MASITPSLFYPRDDYAQERDEFNSVGLIFAIAAAIIIGSLIIYIIAAVLLECFRRCRARAFRHPVTPAPAPAPTPTHAVRDSIEILPEDIELQPVHEIVRPKPVYS